MDRGTNDHTIACCAQTRAETPLDTGSRIVGHAGICRFGSCDTAAAGTGAGDVRLVHPRSSGRNNESRIGGSCKRSPVEAWQRELSLPEAERIAGFKLWQLSVVPEEHQFNQAAYLPSEQMLISVYVAADDLVVDPRPYSQLVLAQQPATHVASSSNMYPIGASAAIETVQIGDVTGEYVEGVWCGANSDPKTPLQWCPSPSSRILRWQRGDWVFTLSALDDANSSRPSITRQQMIELATNIVPSDE